MGENGRDAVIRKLEAHSGLFPSNIDYKDFKRASQSVV